MEKVKRQATLLKVLQKATPKLRHQIIQSASPELIKVLCDCSLNILKGNVPLSRVQKKKLHTHRNKLRSLIKKSVPVAKKKKILQKGGFLPALLLPIAGALLSSLIK